MKSNKLFILLFVIAFSSCNDYLDVVPDNIPTLKHAFNDRVNAEKVLFTCYSYLPDPSSPNYNPALMSGYECWVSTSGYMSSNEGYFGSYKAFNIARGFQNTNTPLLNFWDGEEGGQNLFVALRDCNIFLENIDNPIDLEEYEKIKWIAEVKFLKAYYHFYLLRIYGPIPIVDENIPVSSDPETVRVYREPVDKVVDYIVALLDEASKDLDDKIQNRTQEMGRITKPIALALKAKVLALAASPIFNGNPYYTEVKDNRGINLFSQAFDPEKWVKAELAIKEAIDCAHEAGHELYYFKGTYPITDSTRKTLNVRTPVTEKWNSELIWGSTKDTWRIQSVCAVKTQSDQSNNVSLTGMMSATLNVAEMFYSDNGVPINEDTRWDYSNRYKTSTATAKDRFYIKEGYETANLHFNREPRFYASLYFDGSIVYGNGVLDDQSSSIHYTQMKKGQSGGMIGMDRFSVTGYTPKKLVSYETVVSGGSFTIKQYSFPVIRLADLYLLYAEVLNEIKAAPDADVYKWIDLVRKRASLNGVVESWRDHSSNPGKPATKAGMRDIIQYERMLEFGFEGERYWDLLRWKKAEKYMNEPVKGWDVQGETTKDFYEVKTLAYPEFTTKNYLFPLKKYTLNVNSNLIQNPGWESN